MKVNPPVALNPQETVEVLICLDQLDMGEDLYWRAQPSGLLHLYIRCNDRFEWATADCEPISPATLPVLRQAHANLAALGDCAEVYADMLYCARMRGWRPQHACYPKNPDTWPLFDACGPERTPGLFNPAKHPSNQAHR